MSGKNTQEETLKYYKKLFIETLNVIRILEGGTPKARTYTHVFVHGDFYGGKLGSLLCKKGYKQKSIYNAHESTMDLCKKCDENLTKMAQILIASRARELYDVAGNVKAQPPTPKEVLFCLIKLRELEMIKPLPKMVKQTLFSPDEMEDTKKPVKKTEAAWFPSHPA